MKNFITVACLALLPYSFGSAEQIKTDNKTTLPSHIASNKQPIMGGIRFDCSPAEIEQIKQDMDQYFTQLAFPTSMIHRHSCEDRALCYTLKTPRNDTNTMDLTMRPALDISPDILEYQRGDGKIIQDAFTSKKEILAALMQHGREYILTGPRCSVKALIDHVGVRQNIAKWAKIARMRWSFPESWVLKDGKLMLESKYAKMNPALWGDEKDPLIPDGVVPHVAVEDAFIGSYPYSVGCRTATKLVMVQGIMDYYRHVKKDKKMADYLDQIAERAPLDGINIDSSGHGKYIAQQENIVANNIIPGDWIYITNTDPTSSERTGYEGTNKIYIGDGVFTSLYKDSPGAKHGSPYYLHTPREMTLDYIIQEVFNWRFNIFEDYENNPRRVFLTRQQVTDLRHAPDDKTKPGFLNRSRKCWADLILPENDKNEAIAQPTT